MGFWSSIFGSEDNTAADAKLAELNTRDYGEGGRFYTPSNYKITQAHLAAEAQNPDAEIGAAFGEGLDEGASNIRGTIGGTINKIVGTAFKIVPWQVWLIAVIALVLYVASVTGFWKKLLRAR